MIVYILFDLIVFLEVMAVRENRGELAPGYRFANFIQEKFSYLNITPVGKIFVEESIDCALSCLDTLPCFSFNLADFRIQDDRDKLLCEHLPSDKYNNSDKFVVSQVFHHFSIWVSSVTCRVITSRKKTFKKEINEDIPVLRFLAIKAELLI